VVRHGASHFAEPASGALSASTRMEVLVLQAIDTAALPGYKIAVLYVEKFIKLK
jgi:hypothetical protein